MLKIINGIELYVSENEFPLIPHKDWFNLRIVADLPRLEQQAALIRYVKGNSSTLTLHDLSHGGWILLELQKDFSQFYISCISDEAKENIEKNLIKHNLIDKVQIIPSQKGVIFEVNDTTLSSIPRENSLFWIQQECYLSGPGIKLLHPSHIFESKLNFDNLIHFLIMVKNAGTLFRQVLLDNLSLIDHWTILDTGSTDGTQDLIREILKDKPGTLYEEPFVDFKHSRNRLFELAGHTCKFNLMLDDTYVIRGNLREFLQEIRGDQYGDSYSLYIHSYDSEYSSNRITKSQKNLRYIYRIHEVITPENNINVMIPNTVSYVEDYNNDYMKNRTESRKQWDLEILFKEVEDMPDDPRALYYIAQTYRCLENWEKSYEFYLKRAEHPIEGFRQEKIDAIFEAARCANFKLNRPWAECKALYKKSYNLDKTRPDSLYFLGIHYLLVNKRAKAFHYFKKGFLRGYPIHCQYSLKPTLSYHFLPKFLTQLCYEFEDYQLGLQSSSLFCQHAGKYKLEDGSELITQQNWHAIFEKLLLKPQGCFPSLPTKPIIVFCVDGNWSPWTGRDIEERGLGGSETWAVESAKTYCESGKYQVHVFCRCRLEENYNGVIYQDLSHYPKFLFNNYIFTVFVSRYSEWLPLTCSAPTENVYLWVHDLHPSGFVIPDSPKLKGIYGLSQWHANLLKRTFPTLKEKIFFKHYGRPSLYGRSVESIKKIPNRFIYSSTANRGLLYVLMLWPEIKKLLPTATLEIFCDLELKWANEVAHHDLCRIKEILKYQGSDVIMRGWCNKEQLMKAFTEASYWLYPCTFQETFCLTAVEAALHRVLPITNGLAALSETANRGITIFGDVRSFEWKQDVIKVLDFIHDNEKTKEKILDDNESWAKTLTWNIPIE